MSPIYFGYGGANGSNISSIKYGTVNVAKVYFGEQLTHGTAEALTLNRTGGYTWTGTGTSSDKYHVALSAGIRGDAHSPYHSGWTSSNAPKWTVNSAGTLKINYTTWSSAGDNSDHIIYKNGSAAITLTYNQNNQTKTLSVAVGDVIEWRGGESGSYQSDTFVKQPKVWLE